MNKACLKGSNINYDSIVQSFIEIDKALESVF